MTRGKDTSTPSPLLPGRVTKLNTPLVQLKVPRTKTARSKCPSNCAAYIKKLCVVAKAAAITAGQKCACGVTLIQSGFETTWGTSGFAQNENNYFGFHGSGDAGWVAAKKDPKIHVAKFSTPAASFSEYWARAQKHGVSYQDDAQFIRDMTYRAVFSQGTEPKYIREILLMLAHCSQEIGDCCGCKKKQ